ncbi:MAG: UDP-N-acetylmuramate dehydrogenase [Candidatus Rhabdochlamydia sp.]
MNIEENASLAPYTTFKIGGKARYLITVTSVQDLQQAFLFCQTHHLPYVTLGKGSNTLFSDEGFQGVIILNKIQGIEESLGEFSVGAGYSFSLLGSQTAKKGWTGLEFASGIPGSVGGAIFMNAGAHGQETLQVITEVTYVFETGEIKIFSYEEIEWRYRWTCFHEKKGAIASAKFQLTPSDEARGRQLSWVKHRIKTQPYDDASAGCVFRNPKESSAGKIIEACGLKNTSYGNARISSLHANFIINQGGATADDVLCLARHIQEKVYAQTGIYLERELRHISYCGEVE